MQIESLFQKAEQYIKEKISIIVTDQNKKALYPWKKYQKEIISLPEIKKQLSHPKAGGLAVICGAVSGNLEVIDIDTKYDLSGHLYQDIVDNIPEQVFNKLKVVQTRSGGYHFYYRCSTIEGNQKLAERLMTDDEKKKSPHETQNVLIETRGDGGYVVAPPTEGYKYLSGELHEITVDEREMLLSICRSFNEVFVEPVVYSRPSNTSHYNFSEKPWDQYNKKCTTEQVIDLLKPKGWKICKTTNERIYFTRPGKDDQSISGDYHIDKRFFKVFTTSSQFEPGKGYRPFSLLLMLMFSGDTKKATEYLIENGFGERHAPMDSKIKKTIRKLLDSGVSEEKVAIKIASGSGITITEAGDLINEYKAQSGKRLMTFWDIDDNGKLSIMRDKLTNFLYSEGGYSLYYFNPESTIYRIVRNKGGFLEEASTQNMKEFIEDYIDSLEPIEPFDYGTTSSALKEVIKRGADSYFSKGLLEFLKRSNFDFLKDTPTEFYFPFKNGIICINKKGCSLKGYNEINKVIWKSQVIDHSIVIDDSFDPTLCEFNKFIELISGNEEDKIQYCYSLIGYLLHKYKDPGRPWGIVFAEETENEENGGGTGKGILVKAISYLTNTQRIDGKNFKPDKNFAFQRVSLDTRLIAIEDVRKAFDFESYYSVITEGVTIEKKNKDELFVPYAESPKLIVTTNYTVSSNGQHAKRRQRLFEFTNHFNSKFTPLDEFGHLLFDDWDLDEWSRFYNLMFYCARKYLISGVKEMAMSEKIKRKTINTQFSEDFLSYFDDLVTNHCGHWLGLSDEYTRFLTMSGIEKKDYSIKRFKKGLKVAAATFEKVMDEKRNRLRGNQVEIMIEGVAGVSYQTEIEEEYEV